MIKNKKLEKDKRHAAAAWEINCYDIFKDLNSKFILNNYFSFKNLLQNKSKENTTNKL